MRTSRWKKSSNLILSASLAVSLLLTGIPSTTGATTTSSAETEFEKVYDLKNYKTGKLMIHDSSASITLHSSSTIKNGVVFTGNYASFFGDGFKKTSVTIKPKKAGTIVDFNGIEMSKVIIERNNVSEIRGAGNVQQIEYVKGANPDAIKFPFDLSIMHTNDTHGHLDNVAKRVTAVKEVRAEKPNALLLDAGDVFSGTLYFNEFHGMADLQFMNLMGYDAMTFGNHEFDLGSSQEGHQALVDFIEAARFPFVSSNVDFSGDDKFTGLFSDLISSEPEEGRIYNGIIKEINGEKVGIFGLTTADTADISSPDAVTFSDYIEEAERAVAAFESQGVDKIIAVTHIGYDDNPAVDNDLILAATVAGIDVIVGGHSHSQLNEPIVIDRDETGATKDPTLIVQAFQYSQFLGTLDVEFDKEGVITDFNGELIPVDEKVADPEAAAMLKVYSDRVEEVSNTETGAIAESKLENPRSSGDNTLPSVRKNETPLGNLITDGMLSKAKTYNPNVIMALQNGGGIRTSIDAGPITVGEVISVLPFGNTLATMDLTGAELKEAFEISFRDYPRENGGFLHVSGAKITFDSGKPVGERVVSISYKNEDGTYTEISDHETYAIATNAFTAKGGDGYTVFASAYEAGRVTDLGLSDWENFAEHLSSLGNINPTVEGRIIDVAE
ncbi:bifunctional UDP-sugar hydrolase/5'-nucleotidase [Sporosarcina sp. 6E9]|uniref:bifunctional metallophosphatase/5'-nucleotidase n=1 Tax=Sporosarcina sp. 6E9 TaxID=2819235 RepID=UPI001FF0BC8A|nr:5'-nucleotidase C-terminal domain-containing protein [Sporosarcina sp. 6E9]